MVLTLSQQLRFFLTGLRAKIFSQWRQDCPLPSSINRGEFHDPSMKKIMFKVGKKYTPLVFCHLFIFLSTPWPSTTTTLTIVLCTTISTTSSHLTTSHGGCTTSPLYRFLPLLFFPTSSAAASHQPYHHPQPDQWRQSWPLSQVSSLSPSSSSSLFVHHMNNRHEL